MLQLGDGALHPRHRFMHILIGGLAQPIAHGAQSGFGVLFARGQTAENFSDAIKLRSELLLQMLFHFAQKFFDGALPGLFKRRRQAASHFGDDVLRVLIKRLALRRQDGFEPALQLRGSGAAELLELRGVILYPRRRLLDFGEDGFSAMRVGIERLAEHLNVAAGLGRAGIEYAPQGFKSFPRVFAGRGGLRAQPAEHLLRAGVGLLGGLANSVHRGLRIGAKGIERGARGGELGLQFFSKSILRLMDCALRLLVQSGGQTFGRGAHRAGDHVIPFAAHHSHVALELLAPGSAIDLDGLGNFGFNAAGLAVQLLQAHARGLDSLFDLRLITLPGVRNCFGEIGLKRGKLNASSLYFTGSLLV